MDFLSGALAVGAFAIFGFAYFYLDSLGVWRLLTPLEWLVTIGVCLLILERWLAYKGRCEAAALKPANENKTIAALGEPGRWEMAHFGLIIGLFFVVMLAALGYWFYSLVVDVGEPAALDVERLGWSGAYDYWTASISHSFNAMTPFGQMFTVAALTAGALWFGILFAIGSFLEPVTKELGKIRDELEALKSQPKR